MEWADTWDYGYPNLIVDGQAKDDEPLKSAASDALKRAARLWGIGRELSRTLYMYGKLNEFRRFADPDKLRDEYWRRTQALRAGANGSRGPAPSAARNREAGQPKAGNHASTER